MKIVARLFAALSLLAVSVFAEAKPFDPTPLARWAGCSAAVTTSDRVAAYSSFYSPAEHRLYIGTDPDAVPGYVQFVITLHEIGHCLQAQDGLLDTYAFDSVPLELDADRRAADLACSLGLDGPRLLHDTFVWTQVALGYNGDYAHGSLVERISQSEGAPVCHPRPLQSPFQAA